MVRNNKLRFLNKWNKWHMQVAHASGICKWNYVPSKHSYVSCMANFEPQLNSIVKNYLNMQVFYVYMNKQTRIRKVRLQSKQEL